MHLYVCKGIKYFFYDDQIKAINKGYNVIFTIQTKKKDLLLWILTFWRKCKFECKDLNQALI